MELMIVVAILGLIVVGALSAYRLTQQTARDGRRKADLERVRQALEIYRSDLGYYPPAGTGAWTDLTNLENVLVPDFIDQIPQDPKKANTLPYRYKATNNSGGQYYGYCIETALESETNPATPCTPEASHNFTVRNP